MFSIHVFPEMFDPSFLSLLLLPLLSDFSPFGKPCTTLHFPYKLFVRSRQAYKRRLAGCREQRLIPTRISDPLNRKLKPVFFIPLLITYHVIKIEFFINSMALLIHQHLPTRRIRRHTSDKPRITDYFRQIVR